MILSDRGLQHRDACLACAHYPQDHILHCYKTLIQGICRLTDEAKTAQCNIEDEQGVYGNANTIPDHA